MERALLQCDGNVSQAARQLGVSRNTLHRKLSARQVLVHQMGR